MVKIVAATLGYYVDGVQVWKPRRQPAEKSGKKIHQIGLPKTPDTSVPYLIDLKNSMKQGKLINVLNAVKDHLTHKYWFSKALSRLRHSRAGISHPFCFPVAVKFLYSRNDELRIPLYFSSLCGQIAQLRFVMAAYIIFAVRTFSNGVNVTLKDRKTFFEWCEYLGYWKGCFSRRDLQVAYLSALNESVRFSLRRKTFTISDAYKIIGLSKNAGEMESGCDEDHNKVSVLFDNFGSETIAWVRANETRVQQSKHVKSKKPALTVDDDRIDYSEQDSSEGGVWWSGEEDEEGEEYREELLRKPDLVRRQSSAELGKMIFKRSISLGEDKDEEQDFEFVENSSEEGNGGIEGWELVEAGAVTETDGNCKASYAQIASRANKTSNVVEDRVRFFKGLHPLVPPQRLKVSKTKCDDEQNEDWCISANDVADGLKGQRGPRKRGGNRHRGRNLLNKVRWKASKKETRRGRQIEQIR